MTQPLPLDRHDVRRFAQGLSDVIVVEDNFATVRDIADLIAAKTS